MYIHLRRSLFMLSILLISLFLSGCAGAATQSEAAAPAPNVAPAAAPADIQVAQDTTTVQDGVTMDRKIVAHATLELVVSDTQKTVDAISQLVESQGGYTSNANLYKYTYGEQSQLQGTLQVRVPVDKLENIILQLEGMAVEVRNKSINREDVTDQYSDLDAQLRNLSATENELRELLAEVRAKPDAKPEDILAVHNSLTSIRGQIEQIQGHKNVLDNMISLSTIDLTLTPDAINRPVVEEGWRPQVVMKDATRSLVEALQDLADAGIWLVIYLLPILLLLAIPVGVVIWLVRWVFRRLMRKPVPSVSS
ncbi:MAG: DUF4349 domain-containing protein [Caldilineaceae bacterium]